MSRHVHDVKSTQCDAVVTPTKKSQEFNYSEKENQQENADEVEIIGSTQNPSTSTGKLGKLKLTKKEKEKAEKLKTEEEVVNSMRSHWTDGEKTELFEWFLGPDFDKINYKLKVDVVHVFKNMCSMFNFSWFYSTYLGCKGSFQGQIQ
jgi:hypothetical protein